MPFKGISTKKIKVGGGASSPDQATIEAGIQARRTQLLAAVNPSTVAGLGSKIAGYKIVACAEAGADTSAHRTKLVSMITEANGGDGEMFALPTYARYLLKYGSRASAAEITNFKTALSNQTHALFDHGTLNHALMRNTSYYLLAQYFPDIIWKDKGSGTWTSAQVMATNKANFLKRISRVSQNGGHAEGVSSTYAIVNLLCVLNLIDFCQDQELVDAAKKEAVATLVTMRALSHYGSIVAPITRRNVDQLNAPDSPQTYKTSVGQHILWYYYGGLTLSTYDLAGDAEPLFASFLASSGWRPPLSTYSMEPGEVFVNVPSFSQWDGDTFTNIVGSAYVCDDFAVGTGNCIFEPAGYSGWQTFSINFKSTAPQNQISCYHPYFDSNLGEDNWATSTNRWSPFQQMYRYDNSSVIMIFNIPESDPWQYDSSNSYWMTRNNQGSSLFKLAQYRIPLSADEIDTSDPSGQWVFVRAGNTMIGIGTLQGTNEYPTVTGISEKYKVVKIRQARTAIFWRVESGTDFEAFKARTKTRAPTFVQSNSPYCLITEEDGTKTRVTYAISRGPVTTRWVCCPTVTRNGVTQPMENPAGLVSTNAYAGSGKLRVASVGKSYSY